MANNLTPNTKEEQDAAYSPEERARQSARALHESEQRFKEDTPGFNAQGDLADSARRAEENPTPLSAGRDFISNFTGKRGLKTKGPLSFLTKKGPLMAISGLSLGGIALLFLVPGFLLFHLLASMFNTYDPSATALTAVTQQMLIDKLGSNDATIRCGLITIACQFKTPTNKLLSDLKDSGITPLDEKGDPMEIDLSSKWPTKRPSFFQIHSSLTEDGKPLTIAAGDLKGALQDNTVFRQTFNKVLKKISARAFSRLSPALLAVLEKFKLKLSDPLNEKARTTDTGTTSVNDVFDSDTELKGASGEVVEGTEAAASTIISDISLRINKLLTLVGKAGKGSGIVLGLAMQCMADEIPGMIEKTMTALQDASSISAAQPVVTAMSAIKAGDGDPDTTSQLGNEWTQLDSNGQSALNSIGVRYATNGDTNTASDPSYQNVTPAAFGGALSDLDIADKILKNPVTNVECAALMNPISGAAIAAGINAAVVDSTSLGDFGLSYGINLVLGVTMTALIDNFSSNIADGISNLIGPGLGAAIQPALDKMKASGPTFGNVVTSGFSLLAENNGAQTFGTAMTTDQLSAYSKQTQNQELADAELDRATLSPFDASSPYTFLGTIVSQFMPYYSSFSSISGGLSILSNLLPISFGSIFNMSTASALSNATPSIYSNACPTPVASVSSGKLLAADVFCHKVYGMVVPSNWDPSATETSMESMQTDGVNEIDNTGKPIADDSALSQTIKSITDVSAIVPSTQLNISYSDWLATCTDPENATECTDDDPTETTYGLYTASTVVNTMLNGDATAQ